MSLTRKQQLLVFGYCHNFQTVLNNTIIPTTIIEICLKFYQNTHIITIGIGSCGMRFSLKLFDSILTEYNINKTTGKPIHDEKTQFIGNTYLREKHNQYTPRALFIDTESL